MPVSFCGCSSVGRASAFQAEGRGSESRRPLHFCAPEGMRDRDLRGAGEGKNPLCHHIDRMFFEKARVAQSVERVLGKDEVTSSILVAGSIETREKESV